MKMAGQSVRMDSGKGTSRVRWLFLWFLDALQSLGRRCQKVVEGNSRSGDVQALGLRFDLVVCFYSSWLWFC